MIASRPNRVANQGTPGGEVALVVGAGPRCAAAGGPPRSDRGAGRTARCRWRSSPSRRARRGRRRRPAASSTRAARSRPSASPWPPDGPRRRPPSTAASSAQSGPLDARRGRPGRARAASAGRPTRRRRGAPRAAPSAARTSAVGKATRVRRRTPSRARRSRRRPGRGRPAIGRASPADARGDSRGSRRCRRRRRRGRSSSVTVSGCSVKLATVDPLVERPAEDPRRVIPSDCRASDRSGAILSPGSRRTSGLVSWIVPRKFSSVSPRRRAGRTPSTRSTAQDRIRVSPAYRPRPRASRMDVAERVGQQVEVAVLERRRPRRGRWRGRRDARAARCAGPGIAAGSWRQVYPGGHPLLPYGQSRPR